MLQNALAKHPDSYHKKIFPLEKCQLPVINNRIFQRSVFANQETSQQRVYTGSAHSAMQTGSRKCQLDGVGDKRGIMHRINIGKYLTRDVIFTTLKFFGTYLPMLTTVINLTTAPWTIYLFIFTYEKLLPVSTYFRIATKCHSAVWQDVGEPKVSSIILGNKREQKNSIQFQFYLCSTFNMGITTKLLHKSV